MKKVLYPGSFDPFTKGHISIVRQASELFDEVVIAVLNNPTKKTEFFTVKERAAMIAELYQYRNNIKVVVGSGATVDIALLLQCNAIVRGIRSSSDYAYEAQLQQVNREISDNKIKTVCLFTDNEYQHVSSSMVKEVFALDKDISNYVDYLILKKMKMKKRTFIK